MLVMRIALLATLWVVGGCSASSGDGSDSPRPSGDAASLTPASQRPIQLPDPPTASPGPLDLSAEFVDPVVADIARFAGVPVDQVVIRSTESLTFPNAGLGCPVPGMVYAQVQVEGFKIVADVGGKIFDYRGTGPGRFRRCTPAGR